VRSKPCMSLPKMNQKIEAIDRVAEIDLVELQ